MKCPRTHVDMDIYCCLVCGTLVQNLFATFSYTLCKFSLDNSFGDYTEITSHMRHAKA